MNASNITGSKRPLRILTWHVHGNYLYYLTQAPCHFYLPVKRDGKEGYGGRTRSFLWGDNVEEIDAGRLKEIDFDCILFQSKKNYLQDQYDILSEEQRRLPKIYLEHDPPRESPTDTHHIVDDPDILLVHVTHFNDLMWDSNRTPTTVIEHGVLIPEDARYTGTVGKGVVVINGINERGRRLGLDVFKKVRSKVPLDIVGMGSEKVGGLGEIYPLDLPAFISQYRFFFNPIRYTSLGLAVCEAMMVGMPVVGLATTEMPVIIENGVSGYVNTDIDDLIEKMQLLIKDPFEASRVGSRARAIAQEKFNINRFSRDWMDIFSHVVRAEIHEGILIGGVQ